MFEEKVAYNIYEVVRPAIERNQMNRCQYLQRFNAHTFEQLTHLLDALSITLHCSTLLVPFHFLILRTVTYLPIYKAQYSTSKKSLVTFLFPVQCWYVRHVEILHPGWQKAMVGIQLAQEQSPCHEQLGILYGNRISHRRQKKIAFSSTAISWSFTLPYKLLRNTPASWG